MTSRSPKELLRSSWSRKAKGLALGNWPRGDGCDTACDAAHGRMRWALPIIKSLQAAGCRTLAEFAGAERPRCPHRPGKSWHGSSVKNVMLHVRGA